MKRTRLHDLSTLEGRQVSVALKDGSRIDDCQLVSRPRNRVGNVWLFVNGEDSFVSIDDVVDVWEVAFLRVTHAA
jgi:hypothetical protein